MLDRLRRLNPNWTDTAEARYEQFSAHRKQAPIFLLIVVLNASIPSISAWGTAPANFIFLWCLCLTLAAMLSIIACGYLPGTESLEGNPHRAIAWTVRSALALGVAWGIGSWALYDFMSPSQRMLLTVLTVTTAASGAVALSVVPRAVIAFVLPAVIPIFFRILTAGEIELVTAAATAMVFVLSILAAAWIAFHTFAANVNARLDLAEKNLVIQLLLKDFEDTTSDWLWATDSDLRFTHLSERGLEGVRLSAHEALGKTPEEMSNKNPDLNDDWRKHLDTLKAHKPFHDFLYESHHADGGVSWLLVSGKPQFNRNGDFLGYRGVMSDITAQTMAEEARKKAEGKLINGYVNLETRVYERTTELRESKEKLQIAKEAAEAANRAKDNFIANISHELRTPLNSIIGFSELMAEEQMGSIGNPEYARFSGMIHESGLHLLDIVNDVLDLSKSAAEDLYIKQERLDVGPIAKSCAQLIREQCERKGVSFVADIEPDLPEIVADPVRLRQIALNLLSNAVKFTDPEEWIKFSVMAAEEGGIVMRVADTGIGMNKAEIRVAMEPFGQADSSLTRRHEGTGLGLPLTKMLVERHGGEFHIDSTPGEGTTIEIRLRAPPCAAKPAVSSGDTTPASEAFARLQ